MPTCASPSKGKTANAKAAADGKWLAKIETGVADANGATLTISVGAEKIEIKDVLVGEVWFASGQSNMFFTMDRVPEYAGLSRSRSIPACGCSMRHWSLPSSRRTTSTVSGRRLAGHCPGVFRRRVFLCAQAASRPRHSDRRDQIRVGWQTRGNLTSREALNTLPGTKALVDATVKADAEFDPAQAKAAHKAQLAKWPATIAEARKKLADKPGKLPKKPQPPKRPLDTEGKPGVLFNSMINPFVGYTMRGAIWYQGEFNARVGAVPYDQTLPLMIGDWRQRWGDNFSFYFVQLANFHAPSTAPGIPDPWALLQDRMRRVLDTTPKTGMAIINDVGEAKDIHPKNKKAPGERLALWALAKDYGKPLTYSGPLFKTSEVKDGAIRVTFGQAGDGLKARTAAR